MKLTLVQPPSGRHDRHELAPPLGLLMLAAVAEDEGVDVEVLDFNLRGMQDPRWVDEDFYGTAVSAIAATNADAVGFTSMALESHLCIELARELKVLDPGLVTIFGGAHFSSIAHELLQYFDFVDYVVCGEGEGALSALLRHRRNPGSALTASNIAHRTGLGTRLERTFKPMTDLSHLPFPAYHLVDLQAYFQLNANRVLDFEHARGCNLRCTFCYSPNHWGQGEQTRALDRVVEDMARHRALGADHLFFVSDNLVNSKPFVSNLMAAIEGANLGLTWNGYATIGQLTPDIIDSLADAGCTGLFLGVDAVTESAKSRYRKRYFRGWDRLARTLSACLARGIDPTCAFMVDIPDDSFEGTERCLDTALMCANLGCGVRLNTLAIYNGTALDLSDSREGLAYSETKAKFIFDTHPVVERNHLAEERPHLFPLHQRHTPQQAYDEFLAVLHIAFTLFHRVPRTLLRYRIEDSGSLWALLNQVRVETGDIAAIAPEMRRDREVEALTRVIARIRPSSTVVSALELECAERDLAMDSGSRFPVVKTTVGARAYGVAPHRVVRLSDHPARFDEERPLEPQDSRRRPYLLVRSNGQLKYFEARPAFLEVLGQLQQALDGDVRLRVPMSVLKQLEAVGLLLSTQLMGASQDRRENHG